jgi:dynein heavy chain 1
MDTMNDNTQFNEQSLSELVDYLSNVAHYMIDINKEVLYKELFAKSEVIKSFVSERNTKMLCISKVEGDEPNSYNLDIKTDLLYKYPKSSTCCFIKKDSTLEINDSKNFSSQVQVLNFSGDSSDSNVLSFMQTYIQNAFSPFFNSFHNNINGSASNETKQNIKSTTLQTLQNKMSELVFLLNQSQKNSEIPTVKLELEHEFREYINQIRSIGKEPTVDDFQDKIGNDIFLRKLADSTNRWKTDISAVLKLDRQISQGNTLEEITFWKDYENTLSNSK